jgi:hypothetical protein
MKLSLIAGSIEKGWLSVKEKKGPGLIGIKVIVHGLKLEIGN